MLNKAFVNLVNFFRGKLMKKLYLAVIATSMLLTNVAFVSTKPIYS
jgi:hypothetical protein